MYNKVFYTDGQYTKSNPGFNVNESFRKVKAFIKLKDEINIYPEGYNILDLGCGSGGFLCSLSNDDLKLNKGLGIDINSDAINEASSSNLSKCSFEVRSFNDIIGFFDIISIVHVLEHIESWSELFKTLKNHTNYIYISVPIEASVWMTIRKNTLLNQYQKYGHIHFFNEPFLLKILEDMGLKILKYDYTDEFLSFKGINANLAKIPRLLLGHMSKRLTANLLGGYCLNLFVTFEK